MRGSFDAILGLPAVPAADAAGGSGLLRDICGKLCAVPAAAAGGAVPGGTVSAGGTGLCRVGLPPDPKAAPGTDRLWGSDRGAAAGAAPPESLAEEDYRAQLLHLRQLCTELQSAADNRYRDAIEYYTTWAHQIKTPIASMRLALQGEDTALFRRLLSDLSRTEQYVEMVMAFLRLEDAPGDYVFREVALDEVLRQALRRFSAEFIDRRLRLDYTPTELTVLTDEKWLCFVLEQLLSNALKYTREGSITVELAGERVLAIRDTGIGIAPEDLPRIFEKGYTGQNGRADKRASGLGLYLCSRICRNLGVGLTVKSTSGVGTTLLLDFTQYPLRVE